MKNHKEYYLRGIALITCFMKAKGMKFSILAASI